MSIDIKELIFKYAKGYDPETDLYTFKDKDLEEALEQENNNDVKQVAAEAYQIIGVLSEDDFNHPSVQKALTYFSNIASGKDTKESILPFALEKTK